MLSVGMLWLFLLPLALLSAETLYYENEKLTPITHLGHVELKRCFVEEMCTVTGSLNAFHSLFDGLVVNGDCFLNECVVTETGKIRGKLFAERSVFKGPLELTLQRADFRTSVANDIEVKPYGGEGEQSIILSHGTHILGNVHFESKKGAVYLYSDSKLEGAVIGGKLVRAGCSPTN